MKTYDTIIVNLFAGPGAGKSTTAAYIFAQLKWAGREAELVTEFAKDLLWERAEKQFENQVYIFGNQLFRIHRLLGEVEFIVTDSPILLTTAYSKNRDLVRLALNEHNNLNTFNIFVERSIPYSQVGRFQNEHEAKEKDKEILRKLEIYGVNFFTIKGTESGADWVVSELLN